MEVVAGSHTTHDVEGFCRAINAGMKLDRLQRSEVLLGVSLPTGYDAVALRFAEAEPPAVFMYSTKGRLSAATVAAAMAVKGSSCATPNVMETTTPGILNLIIDDQRRSDSPRFGRRP